MARQAQLVGPASARVRAVPDTRTIRYYTTLGLIDKPSEMRGRTAFYGKRHVLQIVAIKRLQAEGLTLEAIQNKLLGATERTLGKLADIPADFWASTAAYLKRARRAETPVAKKNGQEARGDFWAAPVAAAAVTEGDDSVNADRQPRIVTSAGLQLAPGVTLTIAGLDAAALQKIQTDRLQPHLQAIVEELIRQGLLSH